MRFVKFLILLLCCSISHSLQAATPGQYIAKLYTEALGRAPDVTGWNGKISYFNANGCNNTTLRAQGQGIFGSTEFSNLGYSNPAKVLILYRTILDREPDSSGFATRLAQLNAGTPLSQVVDNLYNSPEFQQLTSRICSGNPYFFNALGAGSFAIQVPGTATMSQASLQASLNSAVPNGVVSLPPMTLVRLTTTLTIPAGVTLTTIGNPGPNMHANMARLIRDAGFSSNGAVVQVQPGGKVTNIWMDGQRGALPMAANSVAQPYSFYDINIQTLSGSNTTVSYNFISNTVGWSSLQVLGSAEIPSTPCNANQVVGNVITAYSSNNKDTQGKHGRTGLVTLVKTRSSWAITSLTRPMAQSFYSGLNSKAKVLCSGPK